MPDKYADLINKIKSNDKKYYECRKLSDYAGNDEVSALSPRELCEFVVAASKSDDQNWQKKWLVQNYTNLIMARKLPFRREEIAEILDGKIKKDYSYGLGVGRVNKVIENYLAENELTADLKSRIKRLIKKIESDYQTAETRKWAVKLKELSGEESFRNPLVAGEAWSDAAIEDFSKFNEAEENVWLEILSLTQTATGGAPKAKWLKAATDAVEKIGFASFKSSVLKWFALVDKPRTDQISEIPQYGADPNLLINDVNADILKGLVWLCGEFDDAEIARSLTALAISAYKKVPQVGPRCVRVGNACVYAIGKMNENGVAQLALLKIKIKFGTAQNLIEKELNLAAEKAGITAEELEEMSVPAYGLKTVGVSRETFGDYAAELKISGTNQAELNWFDAGGKQLKSVPKAVKESYAEELKELNQSVKDLKKMLPAQRDRLENLYLEKKFWDFKTWRTRYLDHPLVGTLARRIVWRFDEMTTAVWSDGKLVDSSGGEMTFFDDTKVDVWHPLHSTTAEVLEWREFLETRAIKQPFKQAHREIYLLTDAERNTRVYSNRFAAHIIKQHQFNALAAIRGWKNQLRLMVDDSYHAPSRFLEKYNLRAEFWVEGIGEDYGTDTTESGTYLYLATDQVRFYEINAPQLYAHAGGGGYYQYRHETDNPLPLETIPPLVLSEILRDVDLFVGVGSIGNDPSWMDGGNQNRYADYWQGFAFGDLTETAKTRRQVLAKLVPRLKIADRCELGDKFLTVRGDIRNYKIHLGSGNILMSPNDQYLCIVASGGAEAFGNHKVFLPFEGDRTMAIILSKALMLAEDTKINDPTITRQIKLSK